MTPMLLKSLDMPAKWLDFRAQFPFSRSRQTNNLAGMVIASNPDPVRTAIESHRASLDSDPFGHLQRLHDEEAEVCGAVNKYFGVPRDQIALTSGTTQGLSLLYAGITVGSAQEIVTTLHEFSGALEIFKLRTARAGTLCRQLQLIPNPSAVSVDAIIGGLKAAVCSHTRVLALTWVHSNTGVKMPIRDIADWLSKDVNANRSPADRVLLCVDGVHGFGVEATTFPQLGCDFFVAGCHKWIFGPRGTGVWCGTKEAWEQYVPITPTSSRNLPGLRNSPGGVQDYEHRWALQETFEFLVRVGPADIQQRVHSLATAVKEELRAIEGVTVVTPLKPELSSAIVCLDVAGKTAQEVVAALSERGIIASVSSSDAGRPNARHVRLSIAAFNDIEELEDVVREIASLV